jgi:hypothetical protein
MHKAHMAARFKRTFQNACALSFAPRCALLNDWRKQWSSIIIDSSWPKNVDACCVHTDCTKASIVVMWLEEPVVPIESLWSMFPVKCKPVLSNIWLRHPLFWYVSCVFALQHLPLPQTMLADSTDCDPTASEKNVTTPITASHSLILIPVLLIPLTNTDTSYTHNSTLCVWYWHHL